MKKAFRLEREAALLLGAIVACGTAAAHTFDEDLANAASATDTYTIQCASGSGSANSHHLKFHILDKAPVVAATLTVTATRNGSSAASSDGTDGDAAYSAWAQVNQGAGAYTAVVSKNATGVELYRLEAHCENSSGGHTGTTITLPPGSDG